MTMLYRISWSTCFSRNFNSQAGAINQSFTTRKRSILRLVAYVNSGKKSQEFLRDLERARTQPYPPLSKNKQNKIEQGLIENVTNPPLPFDLVVKNVEEQTPTQDELSRMLYISGEATFTALLQRPELIHQKHPTSARALHELIESDRTALRLPILVNWPQGIIGFGIAESKKKVLGQIQKKRDKALGRAPPEPPKPSPPPPPPDWVDYD